MYNSQRDFISRTIFRTEARSFAIPKPCNKESERERKLKRDAGEPSHTQTSKQWDRTNTNIWCALVIWLLVTEH